MRRTSPVAASAPAASPNPGVLRDETDYYAYLQAVQAHFLRVTQGQALFAVEVSGEELWDAFLSALDPADRQHNSCHSCRQFIQRFGNLVVIQDDGSLVSPFWATPNAPAELANAVATLQTRVESARVEHAFLTSETSWGTPRTRDRARGCTWQHFAVTPTSQQVYRGTLTNAGQRMAELREDFRCLKLALDEFGPQVLDQARTILEADVLSRSEKFLGVVTWLQERHLERKKRDRRRGHNLLWKAVAAAPAGFCKPRGSVVGSLLEDLLSSLALDDVIRRFNAKLHPLQYQRPQAAPAAQNIRQAEEAVRKLGLERSLERRFATLDDVRAWVWRPRATAGQPSDTGIFGHLQPKQAPKPAGLELPEKTLTWVKFRDTVLPTAEQIEFYVPGHSAAFCPFVTAADPAAPPLLQWDREDERNPVSWYYYWGGRPAHSFSLRGNTWTPVEGITLKPNLWQPGFEHHGVSVLFVVEGARDTENQSLGLFPELLRSELHAFRSTLESFSQSRIVRSTEGPLATGLMYDAKNTWADCRVRVQSRGNTAVYRLDRWD